MRAPEMSFVRNAPHTTSRLFAALVLAWLVLPATASMAVDTDSDVVIVGAGVAGLRAAYQLNLLGWSVKIIEAQDTHGGRVHDSEIDNPGFADFPVELGAEQGMASGRVGGQPHFLYGDVEALDPARMVQDGLNSTVCEDGGDPVEPQAKPADFAQTLQRIRKISHQRLFFSILLGLVRLLEVRH